MADEWPPPHMAPAYQAYRDWEAWYIGEPGLLADVYRQRTLTGPRIRPSQQRGGMVGLVSRWIWGAPPRTDQRDHRVHAPVPADLAATAAGLLFAEPPGLVSENLQVMDALETLMGRGLHTALRHGAEMASTMGDVYLRPVVDLDADPDGAIVTTVPADAAIPTIRWGRLINVTFWSVLHESAGTVLRLLERHDVVNRAGRITYSLHQGTDTELGRVIPLTEHPDAEYLAELVDETGAQATGLDRLDVVRVPNAGPQRRFRRLGQLKYLGRSDLDGNEQLFDRIDESWTSWMRDLRLARGRITAPAYMLQDQGAGQGAVWDPDREVYSAINAMPGDGVGLTISQFAIRHVEHKATIDALMEAATRHAGLSTQTVGEEGDVAMTATEAQARERLTFLSRGDRVTNWAPRLAEYLWLHMAVEARHWRGRPAPELVSVEFADSVTESPETTARTAQLLRAAEAASTETLVRMVHPDWDDDQVTAEVERIKGDQPAPIEVGGALGALAGNEPAPGEGEGQPSEE